MRFQNNCGTHHLELQSHPDALCVGGKGKMTLSYSHREWDMVICKLDSPGTNNPSVVESTLTQSEISIPGTGIPTGHPKLERKTLDVGQWHAKATGNAVLRVNAAIVDSMSTLIDSATLASNLVTVNESN